MKVSRFLGICFSTCLCAATSIADDGKHAPKPLKHLENKLTCNDCHQKEDPKDPAVADDSCMPCHGDYPAMVAYTKHLSPNPHNPPTANKHPMFKCTECHAQHKAPVVKCLECHADFKMKAK
jgi:hypothetical protein